MTEGTAADFLRQTAEPMDGATARLWFKEAFEEFHKKGATWGRMSVDDHKNPTVWLCEGWRKRPTIEAPVHFHMVPA